MLVQLPSTTEFFSQVGTWSSAMFDELKPLLYYVVGISLAITFFFLILRGIGWLYEKIRGRSEE
jgi:hypothetical protein